MNYPNDLYIHVGDIRMFTGIRRSEDQVAEVIAVGEINDQGERLYVIRFIETGQIFNDIGVHCDWISQLVSSSHYEVCE